jgi:hypothetical protein
MTHLRSDIVLIEYSDPGAEAARISTNTYALLNAGRMLLVDTNVSSLLPFVRKLSEDGFTPAALVISHRHVVGLGDAIGSLEAEFKIPLLLIRLMPGTSRHLPLVLHLRTLLVILSSTNSILRCYCFLVKQLVPSCCIQLATEACF